MAFDFKKEYKEFYLSTQKTRYRDCSADEFCVRTGQGRPQ